MIKSQITFKQLEAFVCVVDIGTFRKAAEVLGTTQPNVSARIASLEDSLGVVLMHRDARSLTLTEKGKTLLASARQVLWAGEAFIEAAERQDLVAERLRLGVTELIASTWLHDFLRQFRDVYPAVVVELQVNLSVEIERELSARQLDLALLSGPLQQETSASMKLGSCPYVWVATPEIAQATGGGKLAELLQVSVLTHARHSIASRELAKVIRSRGLSSDRVVHSSSLTSCLQMAADGMGAALLPDPLISEAVTDGRLVRLESDWLPPPLEFFARYDATRVPRFVSRAAEMAVETAGSWDKKHQ